MYSHSHSLGVCQSRYVAQDTQALPKQCAKQKQTNSWELVHEFLEMMVFTCGEKHLKTWSFLNMDAFSPPRGWRQRESDV